MIIDIHTHVINEGFDIKNIKLNFITRLFFKKMRTPTFRDYMDKLTGQLNESEVDKAVLIALEGTPLSAANSKILELCRKNKKFLYGANLDPLAIDIEKQVEQAVENKAVLVKLLPSFQNVNPADEKCIPFYNALKKYNLPLLVHTGMEHTLKTDHQNYNNPALLETAAKMGVVIICAHCGCPMYLHEKSFFQEWVELALRYPNVYGDLSGLGSIVRSFYLRKILKNRKLLEKIIFGTDYPAFPLFLFRKSCPNIFNDWVFFFRQMGFGDVFFNRAESLLRL
ncbi:MAG: amidohydrolase family protein [Candidatus Omnitrophica bacterium]|nr:amidohydrolase family protein [Candidatus Omnitrophota bacterium]